MGEPNSETRNRQVGNRSPPLSPNSQRVTRYISLSSSLPANIRLNFRSRLNLAPEGSTEGERFTNIEEQARQMAANQNLPPVVEGSEEADENRQDVPEVTVGGTPAPHTAGPASRVRRPDIRASTPAPGATLWNALRSNLQSNLGANRNQGQNVSFWTFLGNSRNDETNDSDNTEPDEETQPQGTDAEKQIAKKLICLLLNFIINISQDPDNPVFVFDINDKEKFERIFGKKNVDGLERLIKNRAEEEEENNLTNQWANQFIVASMNIGEPNIFSVPYNIDGVCLLLALVENLVNSNVDSLDLQKTFCNYDAEFVVAMDSINRSLKEMEPHMVGFLTSVDVDMDCLERTGQEETEYYRATHIFYFLLLGQQLMLEKAINDQMQMEKIKQIYPDMNALRSDIFYQADDVLTRNLAGGVRPVLEKIETWLTSFNDICKEMDTLFSISDSKALETTANVLNMPVAKIEGWFQLTELSSDYKNEVIIMTTAINPETDSQLRQILGEIKLYRDQLNAVLDPPPLPSFRREMGVRARNRSFGSPPSAGLEQNRPPALRPRPNWTSSPSVTRGRGTSTLPPPTPTNRATPRPPRPPASGPQDHTSRTQNQHTLYTNRDESHNESPILGPNALRREQRDNSADSSSSTPRHRISDDAQAANLCKMIEKALQRGLDAESDARMEPKALASNINRINGYEKDITKFKVKSVHIPQIVYNGVAMDTEDALCIGLERLAVLQAKLEDNKNLKKKQEEAHRQLFSKGYEEITIFPFKRSSDYLAFRESIKQITTNVKTSNNSLPFCNAIYKSLGPDIIQGIPRQLKTVKEINKYLHDAHHSGTVNTIVVQVVNKLPRAESSEPAAILQNLATIMEHVRLIKLFKMEDTIQEPHTRAFEAATLRGERLNEYVRILQVLRMIPSDERERWLSKKGHDMSITEEARNHEQEPEAEDEIIDPERMDDQLIQSNLTDMDRFRAWHKMAGYVAQTLRASQNEAHREFVMMGKKKDKSEPKAVVMPHQEESVQYNQGQNRNKKFTPSTGTSGKPANKSQPHPKLPCPAKSMSCTELHDLGSAFFCDKFKALSIVERRSVTQANNLCKKCLRSEHTAGTVCTLDKMRCRECGSVGDHNRIICPTSTGEQSVQTNVEEDAAANADCWTWNCDEDEPSFSMIGEPEEETAMDTCMMMTCEQTEEENEFTALDLSESLVRPSPYSSPDEPDLPVERQQAHYRGIQKILIAINEAKLSGQSKAQMLEQENKAKEYLLEQENKAKEAASDNIIMVMQETTDNNSNETNFEIPEIRTEVRSIRSAIEMSDGRICVEDVTDQLYPGCPGIFHDVRKSSEVDHLRIGPATAGMEKLFQEIYDISVKCNNVFKNSFMQICQSAVLVETEQAKLNLMSEFPNMSFIENNNETYAIVDVMLDTGASMLLADKKFMKAMEPEPLTELRTTIRTGSGTHYIDAFTHGLTFLCGNGENTRKTKLAVNEMISSIGPQTGMSSMVRKIVIEEFQIPQKQIRNFILGPEWRQPLLLLGLTRMETIARQVNPKSIGGRVNLFNPNLKIWTADIMFSDTGRQKYFLSGTLGTSPAVYSIKDNSPTFMLQKENLDTKTLMDWQKFSINVIAGLEEVEQLEDNGVFVVTEAVRDTLKEAGASDMGDRYAHLIPETVLSIQEVLEKPGLVDECALAIGTSVTNPEESAMITLQAAKEVERFIMSETGWLNPTPLCNAHRDHMSDIARACQDCKVANDPQAYRQSVLLKEIDENLFAVENPEKPGFYTLVQRLILSERRDLMGHLSNNNLHSAIKASKRIVERTKGTEALKILDRGNREYLSQDKYRIYDEAELAAVAEGTQIQQSFCRNFVTKPDSETSKSKHTNLILLDDCSSLPAPVRLVTDTSRQLWTGGSLASLNPAARGFTPSLFSIVARFNFYENFCALDVSKACKNAINNENVFFIPNILDHSIRLWGPDMSLFTGCWFVDAVNSGSQKPYLLKCCVCDFGMGSSHNSLYNGCRRAARTIADEITMRMVLRNLFVDNIGLSAKSKAMLEKMINDTVEAFSKFGLNISKVFMPHDSTDREMPAQTITLGLIWFLTNDTVCPRVKLNIHGCHRGEPLGVDLDQTDVYNAKFSRRVCSRLLSSLYDLSGRFLGPIVAQGKMLLSQMIQKCPLTSNLDLCLGDHYPEFDQKAKAFWSELKFLQTELVPHPRSIIEKGSELDYIVVPHDASPVSIASVIYAVGKNNRTGGLSSNVATSKQSQSASSVPRNEKSSCLHAVNLLFQLIAALDQELDPGKEYTAVIVGDSTISSYMFAGEKYEGDATSKAIFSKIQSTLSCIGNLVKNLTIRFAWVDNSKLKSADYMTKPQSKPLQFANSKEWRHGDDTYLHQTSLEQFTFYSWKDGIGQYSQLPDYLRKVSHDTAMIMCKLEGYQQDGNEEYLQPLMAFVESCSPLDLARPGPLAQEEETDISNCFKNKFEEDMIYLFYPQAASRYFHKTATYDQSEARVPLALYYVVTRSGLNSNRSETHNDEEFIPTFSPKDPGCLQSVSQQIRRPKWGDTASYQGARLSASCYDTKSILRAFTKNTPLLPIFSSKEEYINELKRSEFLHSILNIQVLALRATYSFLRKIGKTLSLSACPTYMDMYCAAWSRMVRSDQHYYPLRSKENFHKGYQMYFNKYGDQDTACDKYLGSLNVPKLAESSPLLRKVLWSVHKEMTGLCEINNVLHNTNKRSIARANTGLFSVTAGHINQVMKDLLEKCTGCLRSSSKFYSTLLGPPVRQITRDSKEGLWHHVSVDELGGISCSPFRGSRTLCRIIFFIFTCGSSGATVIIGSDGTGKDSFRRALLSFQLLTGSRPAKYFVDALPVHTALAGTVGFENLVVFGSHSQHKALCERRTKEIKSLLRKITGSSPSEPIRTLGSLTCWDLTLLMSFVSYTLNMTPIKTESGSYLCPGHLLYPSRLINSICEDVQDAKFATLNVGKYREGNELLKKYHEIIMKERLLILAQIQKDFEKDRLYARKKNEKTSIKAEIGDVILTDYHDGGPLRIGKILELSPHGTDATILVGGKEKTVPVKDLRILSVYRQES